MYSLFKTFKFLYRVKIEAEDPAFIKRQKQKQGKKSLKITGNRRPFKTPVSRFLDYFLIFCNVVLSNQMDENEYFNKNSYLFCC